MVAARNLTGPLPVEPRSAQVCQAYVLAAHMLAATGTVWAATQSTTLMRCSGVNPASTAGQRLGWASGVLSVVSGVAAHGAATDTKAGGPDASDSAMGAIPAGNVEVTGAVAAIAAAAAATTGAVAMGVVDAVAAFAETAISVAGWR